MMKGRRLLDRARVDGDVERDRLAVLRDVDDEAAAVVGAELIGLELQAVAVAAGSFMPDLDFDVFAGRQLGDFKRAVGLVTAKYGSGRAMMYDFIQGWMLHVASNGAVSGFLN